MSLARAGNNVGENFWIRKFAPCRESVNEYFGHFQQIHLDLAAPTEFPF